MPRKQIAGIPQLFHCYKIIHNSPGEESEQTIVEIRHGPRSWSGSMREEPQQSLLNINDDGHRRSQEADLVVVEHNAHSNRTHPDS